MIKDFDPMDFVMPFGAGGAWENAIQNNNRRVCYVRGIYSLKEVMGKKRKTTVMNEESARKATMQLVDTWPLWQAREQEWLNFDELSTNQLSNAVKHKPLKLEKAFLVIALCHHNYLDLFASDPEKVNYSMSPFSTMYVEPAISYIKGLTKDIFENQIRGKRDVKDAVMTLTGQDDVAAIGQCINGNTITHRMALRLKAALLHKLNEEQLADMGRVTCSYNENYTKGPSGDEKLKILNGKGDDELWLKEIEQLGVSAPDFFFSPIEDLLKSEGATSHPYTPQEYWQQVEQQSLESGEERTRAEFICKESQVYRRVSGGMSRPDNIFTVPDFVARYAQNPAKRQVFIDFENKHDGDLSLASQNLEEVKDTKKIQKIKQAKKDMIAKIKAEFS